MREGCTAGAIEAAEEVIHFLYVRVCRPQVGGWKTMSASLMYSQKSDVRGHMRHREGTDSVRSIAMQPDSFPIHRVFPACQALR